MSMAITCAACDSLPDYPVTTFVQDVNEVLLYIAPLVLCVVLWKIFVTRRSPAVQKLL